MQRFFPADYRVILPGADVDTDAAASRRDRAEEAPAELVLIAREERAALRIFLRALRALPADAGLARDDLVPAAPDGLRGARQGPARTRRVRRPQPVQRSSGPGARRRARARLRGRSDDPRNARAGGLAAGLIPVASRLPVYEELLADGEYGDAFEPGDAQTLASQLSRLIADPARRRRDPAQLERLRSRFSWTRVADELEDVYTGLVARRHDGRGDAKLRGAVARTAR